jgi:hypothetical protein
MALDHAHQARSRPKVAEVEQVSAVSVRARAAGRCPSGDRHKRRQADLAGRVSEEYLTHG